MTLPSSEVLVKFDVKVEVDAFELFKLRNTLLDMEDLHDNNLYKFVITKLNGACLLAVMEGKGCFDSPPF